MNAMHKLAATGKYYNTGKVLIGVAYEPRVRRLSYDERIVQDLLLRAEPPRYAGILSFFKRLLLL